MTMLSAVPAVPAIDPAAMMSRPVAAAQAGEKGNFASLLASATEAADRRPETAETAGAATASAAPAEVPDEVEEDTGTESDDTEAVAAPADPALLLQTFLALATGQAPAVAEGEAEAAPAAVGAASALLATVETAAAEALPVQPGVTQVETEIETEAETPAAGPAIALPDVPEADQPPAVPAPEAELAPMPPGTVISADVTAEAVKRLAAGPVAPATAPQTEAEPPPVAVTIETKPDPKQAQKTEAPAPGSIDELLANIERTMEPEARHDGAGQEGNRGWNQAQSALVLGGQAPQIPQAADIGFQQAVAQAKPVISAAAEQLALQFAQAGPQRLEQMTVHLRPATLGQIEVRLHFSDDGHVHGQIMATRQDTLDLLQRDVRHLERSLNDAGLQTDSGSLSFSLRQGHEQGDFGSSSSSRGSDDVDDETAIAGAAQSLPATQAVAADGRLNITV